MILIGMIIIWGYLIYFVAIPLLIIGWGFLIDFIGMIRFYFNGKSKDVLK